ncbi:hypothetical protein HN51_063530 [Arachis hypogaea]
MLENGKSFYNIFMEYAPQNTIADAVRRHTAGLPEAVVAHFTHQILPSLSKNSAWRCERTEQTSAYIAPEVGRGEEQRFPADV